MGLIWNRLGASLLYFKATSFALGAYVSRGDNPATHKRGATVTGNILEGYHMKTYLHEIGLYSQQRKPTHMLTKLLHSNGEFNVQCKRARMEKKSRIAIDNFLIYLWQCCILIVH